MRYHIILCFISLFVYCSADDDNNGGEDAPVPSYNFHDQKLFALETIIQFEKTAEMLDKYEREHILTNEELQKKYETFTNSIATIEENLRNPDYAAGFILHNGINRVVIPHLTTNHRPGVIPHMLLLVRILFQYSPTTTAAAASQKLVEKLLELLDSEENKKFTTPILDIFTLWLPEHTSVQAKFLQSGGLEALYEEIPHLDTSQVHKMLQLFSGIVREHIDVRKSQKSEADNLKLKEYQKVGLLDKLSSKKVCNGLLNIFDNVFTKYQGNNEISITALELLINTREFCMEHFKKQAMSLNVFENFLSYVQSLKESQFLEKMDIEEIEKVLTEDVESLQFLKAKEEL